METTNEKIRQLLEMLDNPDAYTEQEIRNIINQDKDTRETYHLMVEAKRSCLHHKNDKPTDVDAAWRRFVEKEKEEEYRIKNEEFATAQPTAQTHPSPFNVHSSFQKIAASFIGMLLVSGIAIAAIHLWNLPPNSSPKEMGVDTFSEEIRDTTTNHSPLLDRVTGGKASIVFDNIPLEKMLPEIAIHYDAEVIFANDVVRQLRFRFVWNPQQSIEQVISDLNQFERMKVTLKDNKITVE